MTVDPRTPRNLVCGMRDRPAVDIGDEDVMELVAAGRAEQTAKMATNESGFLEQFATRDARRRSAIRRDADRRRATPSEHPAARPGEFGRRVGRERWRVVSWSDLER
ncbi:hypothetical protein ABIC51_006848 [Burkholderia sp. 572]